MSKKEKAFKSLEELGDFMGSQIEKMEEEFPFLKSSQSEGGLNIQRWNVKGFDDYQKSDDGFWVKFEDVEKLLEEDIK